MMWEGLLFAMAFVSGLVVLAGAAYLVGWWLAAAFESADGPCDCRRAMAAERDGIAKWLAENAADKRRQAVAEGEDGEDGEDGIVLAAAAVALQSAADMMAERTRQLRGE